MAGLIAVQGNLKGLILKFEGKDNWIIGRDPDECDFVLEDPKISRRHLAARMEGTNILIENLSITNPAKLNDRELVDSELLQEGDRLSVGSNTFRYFTGEPPEIKHEPFQAGEKRTSEEDSYTHDTIFELEEGEEGFKSAEIVMPTARFIFKVVAGPNTGAEIALEEGKSYLIGTDTTSCDIIFHDLSVSREHARLTLQSGGRMRVEDLSSRNGIVIEKKKVEREGTLLPNQLVALGTSVFLVIDREAPLETLITPSLEPAAYPEERIAAPRAAYEEEAHPSVEEPAPLPTVVEEEPKEAPKSARRGQMAVFTLFMVGLLVLFGLLALSLFRGTEEKVVPVNREAEIASALTLFPGVRYSYNERENKILVIGHVTTGIEKSELFYTLQSLPFVRSIEDHVVNDESVWQEMNILISKNPHFQGVSMSSPTPGTFVLSGYLKSPDQLAELTDFMNANFNYLSDLQYRVFVEEEVMDNVHSKLLGAGFGAVNADFAVGQLILTGYIPATQHTQFESVVSSVEKIPGVRQVRSYVVALSPEQAVIDLNERFPGRYQVSGLSKRGDVNVNVVINGKLLMRGDTLDGMSVTSIQDSAVYFEKEGLKYKLQFNK